MVEPGTAISVSVRFGYLFSEQRILFWYVPDFISVNIKHPDIHAISLDK